MTKFVILSLHRSGTSVLCNMLDRHPDVLCHYEIFHPTMQVQRKKAPGLTDADLALRGSDPHGFVARIFEESGGKAAVGFKMWRGQSLEVCNSLLARKDVHKIILKRENALARYSSHLLAHRNRVWGMSAQNKKELDHSPLDSFDAKAFRTFVGKQNATFKHYKRVAAGPTLHLTYEQLSRAGVSDVLPFLGLTPITIEHTMRKLYSSDILARFAPHLHSEIRECLRDLGRPDWVTENMDSAAPSGRWHVLLSMAAARRKLRATRAAKGVRRLLRACFGAPQKRGR